jgi:hypothetical protein
MFLQEDGGWNDLPGVTVLCFANIARVGAAADTVQNKHPRPLLNKGREDITWVDMAGLR